MAARAVEDVAARAELGDLLTELRKRSGKSVRDLGRAIGIGSSTVSDWCRARTLPFPSQDATFVRLLEQLGVDDPAPWVDALVRVRDGGRRHRRDGTPPYRGLDSFRPQDRDWFFGRDELVERVHKRFRHVVEDGDGPRVLFVVGASGSGKSSVLHAGLVPRLADDGWEAIPVAPGARPLATLASAIAGQSDERPPEGGSVAETGAWLAARAAGSDARPVRTVVIVDQFEELFTMCGDPHERDAFLAALSGLASDPGQRWAVAVGLRIDFYPDLVATGRWAGALQDAQVLVGPMSRPELTAAIVEPARRAGLSVEDALVEQILEDFIPPGSIAGQHDPGSLPLLSHALLETWQHATRGRMTIADYRAAGGIRQAVEDSAEHAFGQLAEAAHTRVRAMFLRLVSIDHNGVATRRAATYDELAGLDTSDGDIEADARTGDDGAGDATDATPATADIAAADTAASADTAGTDGETGEDDDAPSGLAIIEPFVNARLVTAQESTVEIAHEALLAAWPRLRRWVDDDREGILLRRRVSDATQVWLDHDRDPSALAQGARLAAMQHAARGEARRHLNRDECAFLAASARRAAHEERARRRRARRLRLLAAATTVLALLAGSLAVVASRQRADAVAARDDALSRQLAVSGEALRDTDPTLAAHLAIAGYRTAPTSQARSALLEAADLPFTTRYVGGPGPTAIDASSGDGVVAASNSVDGTVQLFTQRDGGLDRRGVIELEDREIDVYALALTPDEGVLAVGDTAPEINLWDVTDLDAPRRIAGPLDGPTGPIQRLDITSDGSELAASGDGDGIFRWDISDPERPRPLRTIPSDTVSWGLAYSPDGTRLAFGQDTGQVRIWDLDPRPREVGRVRIGAREIYTIAFSPDGDTLAAGAQNGELHAWDVTSPASPHELPVPQNTFRSWVNLAAFSPDGRYLVAGSSDAALRVWNTSDWTVAGELPHPAPLTQAAFTHGGDVLVTAAADGVARLWDLAAALPPAMDARVFSLTFSADGTRLAGFSGADTGVWDVSDPDHPKRIVDVTSPDADAPFSGSGDMSLDGDLLAQGGVDGRVHLVDITDPSSPAFVGGQLGGSDALVEQAAFDTDGTLLAAASDDGSVRIWDVRNPRRPRPTAVLHDTEQIMLNVAWSPAAPLLAANSADGYTYLYDVDDPDEPRLVSRLDGFDSESYATAFAPDGNTLAVGGSDTIVLLWDVHDPAHPERLGEPITGPPSRIYDLAFGPSGSSGSDGTTLAAAVTDGTAWLWDTSDAHAGRDAIRSAVLGPFDGPAFTVAISPDGSLLAGSGADQQIHLWPTDEGATIEDICARVGDPMTRDEWATHVPDEPYDPPC